MNKVMAVMLLAATAMPGLASAQQGHGGEHRGDHGQPRAAQPAPARAPAPAPQARAPAPSFHQGPRGGDPHQGGGGQPFGGRGFEGQRPQGQPQAIGRPNGGWNGVRGFDGRAGQQQFAPQAGSQGDPRSDRGRFDRGRFDGQRGGYVPVPSDRGDLGGRNPIRGDQGYRAPDRRYDGVARGNGYRQDYQGGGQWNRGWRDDRRFDWNGYRRYNNEIFRLPRYAVPYGWNYGYRRFGVGFALSEVLYAPDYWIDDPYDYRLPPVYGPYRWVRYYNDALMVDIDTGEVVDVVYGIFY